MASALLLAGIALVFSSEVVAEEVHWANPARQSLAMLVAQVASCDSDELRRQLSATVASESLQRWYAGQVARRTTRLRSFRIRALQTSSQKSLEGP
jgi:hypothetical protein